MPDGSDAPLLLIRAVPEDTAARPIGGVFWESPDIFLLPGVAPQDAPDIPGDLGGGIVRAGADNTVYAQVWNLGRAPVAGATVEFYWFNPTLLFSDAAAHLIGRTIIGLEGSLESRSRKIVKCPVAWRPQFINGGHECLVVRISHPIGDPLGQPPWNASQNRHVGQRNIHVFTAAENPGGARLDIEVGPLLGLAIQVSVSRAPVDTAPWLELIAGNGGREPLGTGVADGEISISPPMPVGSCLPEVRSLTGPRPAGPVASRQEVVGDNQQVAFITTDTDPGHGKANLYRIIASRNGEILGGYSVVILGSCGIPGKALQTDR